MSALDLTMQHASYLFVSAPTVFLWIKGYRVWGGHSFPSQIKHWPTKRINSLLKLDSMGFHVSFGEGTYEQKGSGLGIECHWLPVRCNNLCRKFSIPPRPDTEDLSWGTCLFHIAVIPEPLKYGRF